MKQIIAIAVYIICSISISLAQQEKAIDPKAMAVLDKAVSSIMKNKGISATFEITLENERNNKTEKLNGSLWLKGEKFKLIIREIETYFDGKTEYVYMPKEKEVTISEPDTEELKNINPLMLVNTYNTDYKMRYLGSKQEGSSKIDMVDLYPNDRNKDFANMTLEIDNENMQLKTIKMHGKNGINTMLKLTSISTKGVDDKTFTFDTSKHPEVEIIDLR